MSLEDLASRVSAARAATEARGETFYPGPSRVHLASFPPKERWDDWVEARFPRLAAAGRAPLSAGPHDLFQLRIRLRPARLRRPRDPGGAEVRRQSRAPGLAGAQLRQGSRHPEPGDGPRPHPLPAAPCRTARRGEVGANLLGRGARRPRGAHPQGDRRAPPERDHVPRRAAGRGWLHRAHPRRLGSGRPQLSHQHLLRGRARRLRALVRHRPAQPRSRPRPGDPAGELAPRDRPLLQSARPAHHGGEGQRRQARRLRHPPLQHRHPRRPLAGADSGVGGGDLPRRRQPPRPDPPLRP